ncbi:M20/M25/M40 family metallo-hydrolase [Aliibacillus thermotolerans]|uniref:M20/M25/M40 family metallo-hydrolase n=1 Tax=Aliibacillus thermotolerans TaxID=1834418 RepID=A0ABW0U8V9_9BACI|nr:M20/M25/M40 family metallo-hydrolase [Aliibacillus thermotolerans]MDA3131164.1 M20/M25/M40 family metallo-hydrolase [Aliibacillus thermotolerans]
MINKQRLVDEFIELVQIDSETTKEEKIGAVLKEKFTSLGLEVVEDDAKEKTGHGAGNLICTWHGNVPSADPIYFTSHMDTVVPGEGIQPKIEDGIIRSDGTTILGADDKAGIAAMLESIRTIQENNLPHGTIQFVITVGEEAGLVGAKALNASLLQAKYGFALDSDGEVGNIIVAAPYQAQFNIQVNGKTAHAGVAPEKGISAITVAAKAIAKMPLGRIDEETTANIGRFEGGTQTNIVCDKVHITAEARSLSEEKLHTQVNKMTTAFEETAKEMGATAEVNSEIVYTGFKYTKEDTVVQIAMKASERIGRKPKLLRSGGGSDANIIAGYGVPTVNLSVGYKDIHTTNEHIAIGDLVKLTEMVNAVVQEVVANT